MDFALEYRNSEEFSGLSVCVCDRKSTHLCNAATQSRGKQGRKGQKKRKDID